MTAATAKQIGAIHALAKKAGLDDEARRGFMLRHGGARSTKELTLAGAISVIDELKALAGAGKAAGSVAGLSTPLGAKLRALWIAGYDLGLVKDRTDRAMLAFLERQTGVSHTRFLTEPGEGAAAVEGLKSWLARDGKVAWPSDRSDVTANKMAVLEAQWLRLIALGEVKPFIDSWPLGELPDYAYRVAGRNGWSSFEPHHYDQVQNALGRKLRFALQRREGGK